MPRVYYTDLDRDGTLKQVAVGTYPVIYFAGDHAGYVELCPACAANDLISPQRAHEWMESDLLDGGVPYYLCENCGAKIQTDED